MIPESFVEQLKYASPVEDVIASYVNLKRRGRTLTGLCPFHSEKTPSFTVYPDSQSYYCFGCGSGGDVITFIRNAEHLEYMEALKLLAGRAGMALPEDAADDKTARLKSRVLELNRESARFFHGRLKSEEGRDALAYLRGRALEPKTITRFGLGYAPESWDSLKNHLRRGGFSDEEMLAAAVVSKGRNGGTYDAFRGRVIFPIIDLRGNVIGFGGRALTDRGPKYLNSADTPVFKKSRNLFAMNLAKNTERDTLILAEGYMDVIAIHQAGFDNAVATLGTALTAEQARLLSGYKKKVAIAYDSDAAGQAATQRAINLLGEVDMEVTVLEIKGAKDPDEYIKKFGPQRFESLIAGGRGAIRYEIDKLKARHDLNTTEGKSAFLSEFCRFIAGISGDVQRDVYLSEIARELEVGKEPLAATVRSLRQKKRQKDANRAAHNLRVYAQDKAGNRPVSPPNATLTGLVAEEKLITLLMKNPDCYDRVRERVAPEDFTTPDNRAIYEAVAERLAERRIPELIHLSARLTPDQMGKLSRLLAEGESIPFYPAQAEEYCGAILAEKQRKSPEEIAGMDPEQIQNWLNKQKKRK